MTSPTYEEVAHGAHQIWQDSGCADGRDVENWLEAENRLTTSSVSVPQALNESYSDRAQADAAVEQRHEARLPITSRKSAPKAKPPESGKPLWQQPHSR